ncbi:MAG TPA: c-type cytochrome [Stellaceae bacterium]|nr:c-type cytochrome [Stellaceae bacterium]
MSRPRILLSAAVLFFAALRVAPAAEPDAIKAKIETCFACHGEGGVSQAPDVPSIAGQPSYFTQWQLVFFRNGSLKSELMEPVARELSNDDLRELGAYFQSLPPPPPSAEPDNAPDLTKAGAKLAVERHCNICHAEGFVGQEAAARLAGQREEVLLKALQDYKAGRRTGTGVAAMPEITFGLSEEEMAALAHYLARVPNR